MPAQTAVMLRAAADKSDAVLGSTADVAKKAFPKSAKEIDALVKQLRTTASQRRQEKLRHLGLLTVGAGDNVIRLLPPLIITEAEIDAAVRLLDAAATETKVTST